MNISVAALPHHAGLELPRYAHKGDSGFDLRAAIVAPERIDIPPGCKLLVPTGLIFEIPEGFELQVRTRSGLALKHGLIVLNSPGTVDAGYRGEVCVILYNAWHKIQSVTRGDRIAQGVIAPVMRAEFTFCDPCDIPGSGRGAGGFGSTGVE